MTYRNARLPALALFLLGSTFLGACKGPDVIIRDVEIVQNDAQGVRYSVTIENRRRTGFKSLFCRSGRAFGDIGYQAYISAVEDPQNVSTPGTTAGGGAVLVQLNDHLDPGDTASMPPFGPFAVDRTTQDWLVIYVSGRDASGQRRSNTACQRYNSRESVWIGPPQP